MLRFQKAPFTADASGIGAAVGTNTNVDTHTSAFVSQGNLAVGIAQTSAFAQSPGGTPQVTADAFATATGGNLNIGLSSSVGGSTGNTAYQSKSAYASSSQLLSGPSSGATAGFDAIKVFSPNPTTSKAAAAEPVSTTTGNSASADLDATAIGNNTTSNGNANVVAVQDQYSTVNATVSAGVT